jgi:hypothetical protein
MNEFYWIPEAPNFPGVYANLTGMDRSYGKIQSPHLQPSTCDIHAARKFVTLEECVQWCNMNPYPKFEPKEHGFCSLSETRRLIDNSIIIP